MLRIVPVIEKVRYEVGYYYYNYSVRNTVLLQDFPRRIDMVRGIGNRVPRRASRNGVFGFS